ncbi:MAG TPA: phosphatase PAP2 family protein [Candidatus Hydrogenedentes bacterium]|jgi:membrane-associated PAP2 superfamily phosphatase|nr:MAG: PAP2 superfamily protein [Candidatus Hydrogenedentes bacterium ADurb.Bin170]HNZ49648.1 phosphatase PAP2 family protein [Candidatus Hydrogenedentota bacterium]HOD96337.1 phosphatase PAP2 family protein [Candidatus Hydrogenedentota bacterium]HOM48422.1 phosphatase PAP2 family protein [Candidatus Hydrogenedentota bacterium]HOR50923.1 phosphatase PAP2 family protein [Candidatus Hydrogenedentota bacterium]
MSSSRYLQKSPAAELMAVMLLLPLAAIVAAILSEYSGLDLFLARLFFNEAAQNWPLKSNVITAFILHKLPQKMLALFAVLLLLHAAVSCFYAKWRHWCRVSAYLLVSLLLCTGAVALMKHSTHIQTPWSLILFGKDMPYIRFFDQVPAGTPIGNAFPGGHSSGGFAFISLYYLAGACCPEYRFRGLFFGLFLGTLFAVTQEVRGAHFLSHDLFSLALCCLISGALSFLFFGAPKKDRRLSEEEESDPETHGL